MKTLEDIPEVKPLIKITKDVTLLRPKKTSDSLPFSTSKMGGTPNMTLFDTWPTCDVCHTPLNFVLQIYKDDFSEFYFPDNANIFLLFRCPNYLCEEAFSDKFDLKMFWFYGNVSADKTKDLKKPVITLEDYEEPLPECGFNPMQTIDYPHYGEQMEDWQKFEDKYIYDVDIFDSFMSKYQPKVGTKINGFPDWIENPAYPVCSCGNTKEFFLQLSSEEYEEGEDMIEWPPYAAVMEENGSMFFFVCKQCGLESIETVWEAY